MNEKYAKLASEFDSLHGKTMKVLLENKDLLSVSLQALRNGRIATAIERIEVANEKIEAAIRALGNKE